MTNLIGLFLNTEILEEHQIKFDFVIVCKILHDLVTTDTGAL